MFKKIEQFHEKIDMKKKSEYKAFFPAMKILIINKILIELKKSEPIS